MDYILTKTKYISGLQCPKRLWLEVNDPEKATPPSIYQEHLFELGREVNTYSRRLYPDGVLIDSINPDEVIVKTNAAIEQGRTTIFEGGFLFDEVFVRVDILNKDDIGLWNLIEVKQSSKLKDEHIPDIAIQKYVLEGAGYRITNSILMHINN